MILKKSCFVISIIIMNDILTVDFKFILCYYIILHIFIEPRLYAII